MIVNSSISNVVMEDDSLVDTSKDVSGEITPLVLGRYAKSK